MAQWINLNRNNSFVNQTRLPLLCKKSGAILLVLVGLTAGRQAGRQTGRQTKYCEVRKFLKLSINYTVGIFTDFDEGTV